MKVKMLILLLLTSLFLSSCDDSTAIISTASQSTVADTKSFICLSKVTDSIYMDEHTGVLYVREKYITYGLDSYVITTFPIMEADGTCLTYDEWKARK